MLLNINEPITPPDDGSRTLIDGRQFTPNY
jgi:hypothetical protein